MQIWHPENVIPRHVGLQIKGKSRAFLTQWEAFLHAKLCLHADTHVYAGGLSDEDILVAMMTPCRDIDATLRDLVARYGPRLCVLPDGPMTVPYLEREA